MCKSFGRNDKLMKLNMIFKSNGCEFEFEEGRLDTIKSTGRVFEMPFNTCAILWFSTSPYFSLTENLCVASSIIKSFPNVQDIF